MYSPAARRPSAASAAEDRGALGAGADQRDLDLELLLDELDVSTGRVRKLRDRRAAVERLAPAFEHLVDGLGSVEVALMGGEVPGLVTVAGAIADADRQLREVREDVELGEGELVDSVHAHRVAEGDEVEPAAAALAASHRPVLAAELT